MKKVWIPSIIAVVCISVCIYGAAWRILSRNTDSSPRITDSPERIVSLAPNLTEILFALELDAKIAAVSNESNYPPETTDKKKVGTFWQPNIEAIIAAKPDLVITESFEQQKAVADRLHELGYQVLTVKIEKIKELLTAIRKIGSATGRKQRANELAEHIDNQLNDVRLKLASVDKAKVLWVVQTDPLRIAGRETFVNELIELAGGENAIGPTIQQYPPIGTEELLACRAEVIIQSAMGTSNLAGQQQAAKDFWSKWSNLPAVKNNRIYVIEPDTVLRLGPRLPQGAKTIARCLHPSIFTQTYKTEQ